MPAEYDDAINQPDISHLSGHRPVTLKQVAERAGVSAAAASAALTGRRGTTRVSHETAEMIRKAAVELGYEPHAGRRLAPQQTRVLALALPYAAGFWDGNPFNESIVRGAAEAAARLGYDLMLRTRRNHAWQEWDAAALIDPNTDSVLVVAPGAGSPVLAALAEAGYPSVAAVCDPDRCPLPSVNAADAEGAHAAVTYLIRLGHRRIGHLTGPAEVGTSRPRREGYEAALRDWGLELSEHMIRRGSAEETGGYRAAVEVLARQPRPTALFAFNDLMARGAIDAARQMGLSVPEQLSVIGFDDAHFAATLQPPLTTVRYPVRQIAATAIECLARLAQEALLPPKRGSESSHIDSAARAVTALTLPTQLVVRQSCAPPAADLSL